MKRLLFYCASFHKQLSAAHYFLLHSQGTLLLGAIGVNGTKSCGALVQKYPQVKGVEDKSKNID